MEFKPKKEFATPGLARGILVLRLLAGSHSQSLDELSRSLRLPKSSLLRILETLTSLDLVQREAATGRYSAREALVPREAGKEAFLMHLPPVLQALARETGFTAEWYVPGREGMVLAERREPETGVVRVKARVGFIRHWDQELEAVARLGIAWHLGTVSVRTKNWTIDPDGHEKILPAAAIRQQLTAAKEHGYTYDTYYNAHGVRRAAVIVLENNKLKGVLAVAENFRPGNVKKPVYLEFLLQQARKLSIGGMLPF